MLLVLHPLIRDFTCDSTVSDSMDFLRQLGQQQQLLDVRAGSHVQLEINFRDFVDNNTADPDVRARSYVRAGPYVRAGLYVQLEICFMGFIDN